ncbi:hypothetical protein LBMAG48_24780 [Phycisphaerae bacterium]|nr:hypothetical protein LBMAG48_24780 [Phycisphaerae bacterium]
MKMRASLSLLSVLSLAAGLVHAQVNPPSRFVLEAPDVGLNISRLLDWNWSLPMTDLVKQSRNFGSPQVTYDGSCPVDANGWPTQDFGMWFATLPINYGAGGTYKLSMECANIPSFDLHAPGATITNLARDPVTGIVTGDVFYPNATQNFSMSVTNTGGGARNIKLIAPNSPTTSAFTPWYKNHLNLGGGVLRFMDANETMSTTVSTWANRTKPTSVRWRGTTSTGIPYETCIELCNELNTDLFISVPGRANDTFVRELARLIRDNLNPNLSVYVEWSNEVWATNTQTGRENRDAAIAEVANLPDSNLDYDGSINQTHWLWRRYARRALQISEIFRQEFPAGSMFTRVRPVLSGQNARDEQYLNMLNYIQANYGPPANYFHALAVAPYFENNVNDAINPSLEFEEFITGLHTSINNWRTSLQWERYAAYSVWYGFAPMVAYEAGVDTRGLNNVDVKREVHGSPQMRTLINNYYDAWHGAGGGTSAWFSSGAGPYAGDSFDGYILTENIFGPATNKELGLEDVIARARPSLYAGTLVPATIEARKHLQRQSDWQVSPLPNPQQLNTNQYYEYLIRKDTAGPVRVSIIASSWEADAAVEVLVSRQSYGNVTFAPTGPVNNQSFQTFGNVNINLPAGLSVLRLRSTRNGGFFVNAINVASGVVPCDGIDFNNNTVFPEDADVIDFFNVLAGGDCSPGNTCNDIDFNNNTVFPEDADVIDFFNVLAGGDCP